MRPDGHDFCLRRHVELRGGNRFSRWSQRMYMIEAVPFSHLGLNSCKLMALARCDMSASRPPSPLYARLLCMPPDHAAFCNFKHELAVCHRAALLARALDSAATLHADLLVHISALGRGRQRACGMPKYEAAIPVLYLDQALTATATVAANARATVESLVGCIQLLAKEYVHAVSWLQSIFLNTTSIVFRNSI